MNLNKVFLIGRLTQDVEYKEIGSGTPVATINIATNRVYKDKTGEQRSDVQYHRIIAWGKLAELCKNYISKGRLIMVEGRITYRNWLTPAGEKKYMTEIVAENVTFGPRNQGETGEFKTKNQKQSQPQSDSTTIEEFEPPSDVFEIPY